MFGKRNSFLGVDIGSNTIKVVELEYTAKGPSIVNAGISEVLSDSSIDIAIAALTKLMDQKRFRTKRAIATVRSASEGSAVARRIFMEHLTSDIKKSDLKERVQWEAVNRDYIPFPAEEAVMDCHILGEATQENIPGLWVFFVAVRRDLVRDRVDILNAAGITPIAIEIDFIEH